MRFWWDSVNNLKKQAQEKNSLGNAELNFLSVRKAMSSLE